MKYIRKQEVVEAIQYTNLKEAKRFLGIKDANYDKYTRDLILKPSQVQTWNNLNFIIPLGAYIGKTEDDVFFCCAEEEFLFDYKPFSSSESQAMIYVKHVLTRELKANAEATGIEEPTDYRRIEREVLLRLAEKLQADIKPEDWEK